MLRRIVAEDPQRDGPQMRRYLLVPDQGSLTTVPRKVTPAVKVPTSHWKSVALEMSFYLI